MEMFVSCNNEPADVDIYSNSTGCYVGIHWRKSGYTGFSKVNDIRKRRMQSSAIGGHCHWTQLDIYIGAAVLSITPQYPGREFEEWCDKAVALMSEPWWDVDYA